LFLTVQPALLSLKEELVVMVKNFRGEEVSVEITMLKAEKWQKRWMVN
jgi:hypothetical protein